MKITNKNKETHSHPHETTRRNNSESPPTIPPTKQPTQKTPTSKTNQQGQPIKTNNGTYTHHTTPTRKRPPPKQAEGAPPKKLLSKMNKTKTPNGAQPPYHTKKQKNKKGATHRASNHPTVPTTASLPAFIIPPSNPRSPFLPVPPLAPYCPVSLLFLVSLAPVSVYICVSLMCVPSCF